MDLTKYRHIVFIGERTLQEQQPNNRRATVTFQDFDNIGAQSGGWSVAWQGYNGNYFWKDEYKKMSNASSILDAVKARVDVTRTDCDLGEKPRQRNSCSRGHAAATSFKRT